MVDGRLKELREKAGLSQEKLGTEVGVTQVAIVQFEKGYKTPKIEVLSRIADVLGCTTDYLLGRE